ncbi:hypothetical protein D3C81_1384760 [compost metagenome]
MTIASYLSDGAVMRDDDCFSLKMLGQLGCKKLARSDVESDKVRRTKLAVTLPGADSPEIVHPFGAIPHRRLVVSRRSEVRPPCRNQKADAANDQALVLQNMDMLRRRCLHLDQRFRDVSLVVLMVATGINHWALERFIGPRYTATAHRDVARQYN